jgi:hypothetical protein
VEQLAARCGEVALQGVGLAIIAASSPSLTIEAWRGGGVFAQTMAIMLVAPPARTWRPSGLTTPPAATIRSCERRLQ